MKEKVLVFDTSILCVWLGVPGKETCGPKEDRWDKERVEQRIRSEPKRTIFVLPLATILETGNHIAQAPRDRFAKANELGKLIAAAADGKSPWAAFILQSELWGTEALQFLATTWPKLANEHLSIGDATIEKVANYYEKMGYPVEILTGDQQLKSREPAPTAPVPRRRHR